MASSVAGSRNADRRSISQFWNSPEGDTIVLGVVADRTIALSAIRAKTNEALSSGRFMASSSKSGAHQVHLHRLLQVPRAANSVLLCRARSVTKRCHS